MSWGPIPMIRYRRKIPLTNAFCPPMYRTEAAGAFCWFRGWNSWGRRRTTAVASLVVVRNMVGCSLLKFAVRTSQPHVAARLDFVSATDAHLSYSGIGGRTCDDLIIGVHEGVGVAASEAK
jgi:hypothetical protein